MLLIGILYCMTAYVPSAEDKYLVGFFFVALIALNIVTHLFFLLKSVVISIFEKIREKMAKKS